LNIAQKKEWCSITFPGQTEAFARSCARSKHAKFSTITFHLAYCKWLEKRLHAVHHNFSSLREKGRFSEKKNMILIGKVMLQNTHVLLVNYRDTTKIYVFRHEKIFYK